MWFHFHLLWLKPAANIHKLYCKGGIITIKNNKNNKEIKKQKETGGLFHDSWLNVIVPQILRFNFYQWENTWTFDDRYYKNVLFFQWDEWTVYMWSLPVMIRRLIWCSYYQIWRQTKPEPQGFNSTKLRGLVGLIVVDLGEGIIRRYRIILC